MRFAYLGHQQYNIINKLIFYYYYLHNSELTSVLPLNTPFLLLKNKYFTCGSFFDRLVRANRFKVLLFLYN